MVLPSGTTLSFSQIRVELEQGGTGELETSMLEAFSGFYGTLGPVQRCQAPFPTAYAVSDWWGYDHTIRATARTGSPFALVPEEISCETACDVGYSLSFDTASFQFSGGTIWYLDNGCNDLLPAGKYMGTGRITCSTINSSGVRTAFYDCTTTTTSTTSTTSTTTATPTCQCISTRGGNICSEDCPSPGQECTTVDDCLT